MVLKAAKPVAKSKRKSTAIWGSAETGDFVIVPRVLLRPHLTDELKQHGLQARHVLLLLTLASRKFLDKPIRAYWEELAGDLGVDKHTVRKWAYELKRKKLLVIHPRRGRDPITQRVGHRNDRNEFDIGPFVATVERAYKERATKRGRLAEDAE